MKKALAALTMLAVLASGIGSVAAYRKYDEYKGFRDLAEVSLKEMARIVSRYELSKGKGLINASDMDTFRISIAQTADEDKLHDPWGQVIQMTSLNDKSYELRSSGIDRQFHTWDDYALVFNRN